MARAVSLGHQENSPLLQHQRHYEHYLPTAQGLNIRRDPVVILAILELDLWNIDQSQQQQQRTTFLTKLRIRVSDLKECDPTARSPKEGTHDDATTSSEDEASSSGSISTPPAVTCTAKQLYTKIRQHLAGGSSPQSPSHIPLADSCDNDLDVFIFDPAVGEHVPLLVSSSSIVDSTSIDEVDDIVPRFGTRLRIRLMERPPCAVASDHLPRLTWRHYGFDGTLPVQVTRVASLGDGTTSESTTTTMTTTVPLTFAETPNQPNAGTGFNVWDGALMLAHFLEQQPELVRGRRVLELGAGCGVAGITAAVVASGSGDMGDRSTNSSTHVTLTDLPEVLPLLQSNVERNRHHVTEDTVVTCEACDWFQPSRELLLEPWDVILVADCVWMQDLVAPLLDVLKRLTDTPSESCNTNDLDSSNNNLIAQHYYTNTESMATRRVSTGMDRSLTILEATAAVNDITTTTTTTTTSPVCSMADIYKQRLRHNSRSSWLSKDWDGEASCGSLQDYETSIFSNGSDLRHSRCQEQPNPGRTSISVSDLAAGLNAAFDYDDGETGPATDSSSTHGPTVLISYQRRGKATHDAFFQGLHGLFRHVELLEPPNMDIPDIFYLLRCQR